MTIPDWKEAPDKATHYDTVADLFCKNLAWYCKSNGWTAALNEGWGTERYTPRPVSQTDRTQLVTALNQLRNEADVGVVADVILSIGFKLER